MTSSVYADSMMLLDCSLLILAPRDILELEKNTDATSIDSVALQSTLFLPSQKRSPFEKF
jgi:hypothetical protein